MRGDRRPKRPGRVGRPAARRGRYGRCICSSASSTDGTSPTGGISSNPSTRDRETKPGDPIGEVGPVRRYGLQRKAVTGRLARFQPAGDGAEQVVGARVVVDQPDRSRLGAGKPPGGRVGRIIERMHGVLDARPGRRPHVRLVVQDPRDGLDRNTGMFRDVVDGHPSGIRSLFSFLCHLGSPIGSELTVDSKIRPDPSDSQNASLDDNAK